MDVDTRLLRYFLAVVAEGNLTQAAKRLFVSQPALTKQIKQLEGQLGIQLFVRSRAGYPCLPPAWLRIVPCILTHAFTDAHKKE